MQNMNASSQIAIIAAIAPYFAKELGCEPTEISFEIINCTWDQP